MTVTKSFPGIKIERRKKVSLPAPRVGFTTEPDGFDVAEIHVTVDLAQIARFYGRAAMRNKSRRSKYMSGSVIIEAKSIRRVSE